MAASKLSPYVPSFLRSTLAGSRPLTLTFSEISDTNALSTSSFIYDSSDAPLKSTQQLNVDWSKFENHTFFMSAEAKVNLAFEQIINSFPFDGTRAETEAFFESLTGFDRWVFDSFPKYHGQLHLSGSAVGEVDPAAGSYIVVKDSAGLLYPELSKTQTGTSVLNPSDNSISIEMQIYVPAIATAGTQVICQKLSSTTQGYSFYLVPTVSTTQVEARFSVVSGSFSLTVPATLDKGRFNHVCVTLNKETGAHYLEFFKASETEAVTKSKYTFGDLGIDGADFLIGSGTTITLGSTTVTPTQTLSASLDEFRVFHSARSGEQQQLFAAKSVFATDDLKLYYKFNEPAPPLASDDDDQVNAIVIDSSGNSLHSVISNFGSFLEYDVLGNVTGSSLRQNAATDPTSQVIYEKEETVPVLFPAYPQTVELNTLLLMSASEYDKANPNLVTKLVPRHYLLDGALFDGFEQPEGGGSDPLAGSGMPGEGKIGNVQLFLSFLYIWSRFFDEMKLYIDAFNTLRTVDYDENKSMPNNFLRDLVKQYGFHLPPMFNDSTLEQYIRAENIDPEISNSETPLKHVQNELLRRVLINMPDVIKSKGTQHSIKAFLRAVGIDPENSVRLREYGGPTSRQLAFSRESKRNIGAMVEFMTSSFASSPPLSSSRYEPGYPAIAGAFVQADRFPPNGISNARNDGLFTSGSWTVETLVKYTPYHIGLMTSATQSLARLCVTGSMSGTLGLQANLIAISSSIDPKVVLYMRPGTNEASPLLRMEIATPTDAIFNGDKWQVSFGCERNDSIGSRVSSSYFLRVATQNAGEVTYARTTSSIFYELITSESNSFRTLSSQFNASGSTLVVGQGQVIPSGGSTYPYLNDTSRSDPEARITSFTGLLANMRFWTKALSETEWLEHVRNPKSLGVEDPLVNYNFVKTRSGSFEKIRLDSLQTQETKRAIATASLGTLGTVTFIDFSLNGMHMTGSGFNIERDCVRTELFDTSYISPYFDEAATNEKVRIRSFQDQQLVDATPWAQVAPVYELVRSERPTDDVRFSIEFSLVDALNRDIITLFATLDALDNALGAPELLFSPDYPDIENMRNVYFNRIREKLNFKSFFEFFRWFDTSIGTFISQLVPRKTGFKGTNFTIESHMLERHKIEYLSNEQYLGESNRSRINDVLQLQQFVGSISKL